MLVMNTLAYLASETAMNKELCKTFSLFLLCLTNKLDCLFVASLFHACEQS
jgi:hypothetical protein